MLKIYDLDESLKNKNVQAFLKCLRLGEGTLNDSGYNIIVGGGRFSDFSGHPGVRVKIPRYNVVSTAAGAYQIIKPTWTGLVNQYGFKDFTPLNQDRAAVALIAGRNALRDVVSGNFYMAIQKCSKEWASLPGSTAGQRIENISAVKKVYLDNGGEIKGE